MPGTLDCTLPPFIYMKMSNRMSAGPMVHKHADMLERRFLKWKSLKFHGLMVRESMVGCDKISKECDHCYIDRILLKQGREPWGQFIERRRGPTRADAAQGRKRRQAHKADSGP